jgi:hypothetical protein
MIKKYILPFIVLLICAVIATIAGAKAANKAEVVDHKGAGTRSAINEVFKKEIQKNGYTIQSPENIKKPEVVDNLSRVKSLFGNKDVIFFSYLALNRYALFKGKNRIAARLYCFQFKNKEDASTWFRVIDHSKSQGSRRIVVLSKPKKLLGLAGDSVFLIEGYHISNFNPLYFILNQIDSLEYILSPTETKKIEK